MTLPNSFPSLPVPETAAEPPVTNRLAVARKLTAEALGSALLIIAVVGSGIMAQRLSPTDVGLQLLENAAATAGALIGLILMLGPVSGAHFNPIVTLSFRFSRRLRMSRRWHS